MMFFYILFHVLIKTSLTSIDSDRLLTATSLASLTHSATPQFVHDTFTSFSIAHYGAEKEIEYYTIFGNNIHFVNDESSESESEYMYVSENSAVIGFVTNLPGWSSVEYGTSKQMGGETDETERHFFTHVHWINGLNAGTKYYYMLKVRDERGNVIKSQVKSFTTENHDEIKYTYLNNAYFGSGPPYEITQPGNYVLVEDFSSVDSDCIIIRTSGVNFDLNGHTISHECTVATSCVGIKYYLQDDDQMTGSIVNGYIIQSESNPTGYMYSNTNPNFISNIIIQDSFSSTGDKPIDFEYLSIHGLYLTDWGQESHSVIMRQMKKRVLMKWNVLEDRGTKIFDRHSSTVRLVDFGNYYHSDPLSCCRNFAEFHHNLIKRHRQNGVADFSLMHHNEIYTDSWSTNSFTIQPSTFGFDHYENKLFLTGKFKIIKKLKIGHYVNGWGWSRIESMVRDNFIHLEGIDTYQDGSYIRWYEDWYSGDRVSAFRLTNYNPGGQIRTNIHYINNKIVGGSRSGPFGITRAYQLFTDTSITDYTVEDSYVKLVARDDITSQVTAVTAHGYYNKLDSIPLLYIRNHFVGNAHLIQFGDAYSKGNNHIFQECIFEKIDGPLFHTVAFGGNYWSSGHFLVDCEFKNNADYKDVTFTTAGNPCAYSVNFTLTIFTKSSYESVKVLNGLNETIFDDKSDRKKTVILMLNVFYSQKGAGKFDYNPYYITYQDVVYVETITEKTTIDFRKGKLTAAIVFSSVFTGLFIVVLCCCVSVLLYLSFKKQKQSDLINIKSEDEFQLSSVKSDD